MDRLDREHIKFMAAIVSSGAIQTHGTTAEKIATISITIAREIDSQVDALVEPQKPEEPTPGE